MNAEKNRLPEEIILKWYREYAENENDAQKLFCTFSDYAQQKFCDMKDFQDIQEDVAQYIENCRMNLILATENEQNQVFGSISDFYLQSSFADMTEWNQEEFEESADNALTYLIHQQGHTVEEVFSVCDSRETENCFVGSVIDEMDNASEVMTQLVVLVSASGKEFLDLLDHIAKKDGNLEIAKKAGTGLFDSYMGVISSLDIQLERNLIIPADMVQNFQIEGAGTENRNFTVREVYGLRDSAWESGSISVTDKEPELVAEDMSAVREAVVKLADKNKENRIQSAVRD